MIGRLKCDTKEDIVIGRVDQFIEIMSITWYNANLTYGAETRVSTQGTPVGSTCRCDYTESKVVLIGRLKCDTKEDIVIGRVDQLFIGIMSITWYYAKLNYGAEATVSTKEKPVGCICRCHYTTGVKGCINRKVEV